LSLKDDWFCSAELTEKMNTEGTEDTEEQMPLQKTIPAIRIASCFYSSVTSVPSVFNLSLNVS